MALATFRERFVEKISDPTNYTRREFPKHQRGSLVTVDERLQACIAAHLL